MNNGCIFFPFAFFPPSSPIIKVWGELKAESGDGLVHREQPAGTVPLGSQAVSPPELTPSRNPSCRSAASSFTSKSINHTRFSETRILGFPLIIILSPVIGSFSVSPQQQGDRLQLADRLQIPRGGLLLMLSLCWTSKGAGGGPHI